MVYVKEQTAVNPDYYTLGMGFLRGYYSIYDMTEIPGTDSKRLGLVPMRQSLHAL